jgi:hypothetical protein
VDGAPEEVPAPLELLEPLVAPLDEPLELDVEVTGVDVTGVEVTGVEATGVEAMGVLPVPVVGSVPVLGGGLTATTLLMSLAEPALCVEPPHPDSMTTEMSIAPKIWVISFQRRSILMCIRLANGKSRKSALAIAHR